MKKVLVISNAKGAAKKTEFNKFYESEQQLTAAIDAAVEHLCLPPISEDELNDILSSSKNVTINTGPDDIYRVHVLNVDKKPANAIELNMLTPAHDGVLTAEEEATH